jgi:16S rRNA (cytosine967-C5)-methyltransferase
MRTSGRLSAAVAVLEDFERRRVPLKTALADWARGARYAGAKDRAWISGLCLDALRRRNSLSFAMNDARPRALALATLRFLWKAPLEEIAATAAETPHGVGPLCTEEQRRLSREDAAAFFEAAEHAGAHRFEDAPPYVLGDYPEWTHAPMTRALADPVGEGMALATRADIDLRMNTLKVEPEKIIAALKSVGAAAHPYLKTAARIEAPDPSEKAPAVTVIPAFNKGWVEVQDLGSQIAALATGESKGAQVLDLCAGGGGKTLALAALMRNTGQLYAYDDDPHRLKSIYERARRAGVRNLQIRNPAGGETLDDLAGRMDVVFVDAPCSGSGTWRRHPDAKWRLTPEQLHRRMAEQDAILAAAARYAKEGGRLVYVTCSLFMEENEDRLAAFRVAYPEFQPIDALAEIDGTDLLADEGRAALERCRAGEHALRLTPARARADGFFIAVLRNA